MRGSDNCCTSAIVVEAIWLADEAGTGHRVSLRSVDDSVAAQLARMWEPLLSSGRETWTDRDWDYRCLTAEAAFDVGHQWVVLVDDIEPDARHDIVGTLFTSGPVSLRDLPGFALADGVSALTASVLWIENIAITPTLRDNVGVAARQPKLRGVGAQLRRLAIQRSAAMGCGGRVALHAAGSESPAVYRSWTMTEVGAHKHPKAETYPVFYGDEAWAIRMLEKGATR